MANFTQLTDDLEIITALSQLPNSTDGLSSAQLQAKFDEASGLIKVYINSTLIGELEGTGAAGKIGIATITGVSATNIQDALADLKNKIDAAVVGTIPDASLAPAKLDDDVFFIDHNYYTSTNSSNDYSITSGRSLSSVTAGMTFKVKINADASGNTTLNVDSIGAANILKANGSNVTNLKQDGIYTFVYDGTSFILQGEGGEGTAVISQVLDGETFTNDTGDTLTGTMPNNAGDNVALASSVASTTLKLRAPEGYYDGTDDNVTITDADFVAGNIKTGINLFGVDGNLIKREFATGSQSASTIVVTGLEFQPSIIIVASSDGFRSSYSNDIYTTLNNYYYSATTAGAVLTIWSIASDGFSVQPFAATKTWEWIAFK